MTQLVKAKFALDILEQEVLEVPKNKTAKARKDSWGDELSDDQRKAQGIMARRATALFGSADLPATGSVPVGVAINYHKEVEAIKNELEALQGRYEGLKNKLKARGTSLEIPEVGKRYALEGGGYDYEWDLPELEKTLGDLAKHVFTTTIIPEQKVKELNEGLLETLVSQDPDLRRKVAKCVVKGKARSVRFVARDLEVKPSQDED